jgi:alkylhydroperoxidase family enzyme
MARVTPLDPGQASPAAKALLDRYGVTNMKRTLAHAPVALDAYMRWYDLHAEIVAFLGPRAAMIFAHAISAQTDCLICSTFFRRWLTQAGEDPDNLRLDARAGTLVAFGRQLARDPNGVDDELFADLARHFNPPQIVALTAFAGLMIATNLFNNALKVDLDEYLFPYRKEASR